VQNVLAIPGQAPILFSAVRCNRFLPLYHPFAFTLCTAQNPVPRKTRRYFAPLSTQATLQRTMAKKSTFEIIEPVGARVLVLKDEPKRETKGGIALPDAAEIPTITGRIVAISRQVEHDDDMPLRQYDKIIFHPKSAIPVDFEPDNQLYVVPVEDVVAVFRKKSASEKGSGPEE